MINQREASLLNLCCVNRRIANGKSAGSQPHRLGCFSLFYEGNNKGRLTEQGERNAFFYNGLIKEGARDKQTRLAWLFRASGVLVIERQRQKSQTEVWL